MMTHYRGHRCSAGRVPFNPPLLARWRARPTPANMVRTAETLYWGGAAESRCRRLRMGVIAQWIGGRRVLARRAAIVALSAGVGGCGSVGSIQNMVPDPANFRFPDRSTFLPTTSNSYAYPISPVTALGPADLVDGQGACAGAAPVGSDAASASPRGVSLDMTECQVVRALGQPQAVDLTPQPGGQRRVVMTYKTGERAGSYEFVDGRLTAIERGDEPTPAVAKKPASKKPRPPA